MKIQPIVNYFIHLIEKKKKQKKQRKKKPKKPLKKPEKFSFVAAGFRHGLEGCSSSGFCDF